MLESQDSKNASKIEAINFNDPFSVLPLELTIIHIGSFLSFIDLKIMKSVCKDWNAVASELLYNKSLFQSGFSQKTIDLLKSKKENVCRRLFCLLKNKDYNNFFYLFYYNSGCIDETVINLLDDDQQWFDTFFSKQDRVFLEYHFAIACRNGNLPLVQYLIAKYQIEPFYQHVHYAASSGNLDLVKYLLEKKKCNFSMDDDAHGIFVPAIRSGNLELVKYLISKFDLKPNGVHFKFAIMSGSIELVSDLYDNFQLLPDVIDAEIVTNSKNPEFIKYMLDNLWIPIDDKYEDTSLKMQCRIEKLLKAAYATGKLAIVKEVELRFSCPTHLEMLIDAATSANLETFIYCMKNLKINSANLKNYISQLQFSESISSFQSQIPIENDQLFLEKVILSGSFDTVKFLVEEGGIKPTQHYLLNSAAKSGNLLTVNYLIREYKLEVTEETISNAMASYNLKLIFFLFKQFPDIAQKELKDISSYCRDSINLIILHHLVINKLLHPNEELLRKLAFQYRTDRVRCFQADLLKSVILEHFIDHLMHTWKIQPDSDTVYNIKRGNYYKTTVSEFFRKDIEPPPCSVGSKRKSSVN